MMRRHQSRFGESSEFESIESDFRSSRQKRQDRKTQQLCRQAYRVLTGVLLDLAHDPILADVVLDGVEPAPDASRLLVRVYTTVPGVPAVEIYNRLADATGRLRAELAAAITRKRAPGLAFCVVPMQEGGGR
ncbi:MAG: ribosome-binding factor A [Tepidisphaeraceae bacterium]